MVTLTRRQVRGSDCSKFVPDSDGKCTCRHKLALSVPHPIALGLTIHSESAPNQLWRSSLGEGSDYLVLRHQRANG